MTTTEYKLKYLWIYFMLYCENYIKIKKNIRTAISEKGNLNNQELQTGQLNLNEKTLMNFISDATETM